MSEPTYEYRVICEHSTSDEGSRAEALRQYANVKRVGCPTVHVQRRTVTAWEDIPDE